MGTERGKVDWGHFSKGREGSTNLKGKLSEISYDPLKGRMQGLEKTPTKVRRKRKREEGFQTITRPVREVTLRKEAYRKGKSNINYLHRGENPVLFYVAKRRSGEDKLS